MKKILSLISFILITYTSLSQAVRPRSNETVTVEDARLKSRLNFILPAFADTTSANFQIGVDSCGAVIFTYNNNRAYLRECSPKRWVLLGSGGGGVSVTESDTLFVAEDLYVTFDEEGRQILRSSKVGTVSELRSLTSPQTGLIYMSTDYGGGTWLWDDTLLIAEDTGRYLKLAALDTGRLVRQYSGALNCTWFGIKGDSVTDNLAAFVNMFAAVGEGYSFYLPAGMYMVSCNETLGDIIIPSNTHFFGAGMGLTTIKLIDNCSAGTSATVNLMLTEDDGTDITIEGITLDGNRQNQSWLPIGSANYGLGIRSNNTTVLNVEIKNVTANGTGMSNDGPSNVIFDKVHSHDNGKKGFHSGEVTKIKIINGFYYNNEEDAGIGIHAGMKKALIDNNYCYNNRTGIQIGNSTGRPLSNDFIISNNIIEANEVNGISIGGSNGVSTLDSLNRNCNVTGNIFINDFMQFTGANNVNFVGNTLTNSYIKIETSFNLDIKNNKIKLDSNNSIAAIHIAGGAFSASTFTVGDNINVSNNTIEVAPEIDYGISAALTTNLTIRDNTIIGTANVNNVRVWSKIGTAIVKQLGSGSVRIDGQTFANGYDNTGLTVHVVNPDHGKVGQVYFLTPSNQLRVCGTASTYDGDGAIVDVAVWVNASPAATETLAGLAEYANQAETDAGVATDKIVSPFRLRTMLSGISGGQTFRGGLDSGDDLFLYSTAHATKGRIYFGVAQNSWYDEGNNQFGIGVGAGATNATDRLVIANTSAGAATTGARFENNSSTAVSAIDIDFDLASSLTTTGKFRHLVDATGERHFTWQAYNGSALGERMRLTGVGNLLLGTTTNNASAMINMSGVTGGLAVNSMTTTQRNAIASPLERIIVYDNTLKKHHFYNGSGWAQFVDIINSGAAATAGTATFSSGTVTVNTTAVAAGSIIEFSYQDCSSCGTAYKGTITAGTSFVINSTNVADASIVSWRIIY